METCTFGIDGMTCPACPGRIEKKLKSMPGVAGASVNYDTATATVTYHAETVTYRGIKAAVEDLDYRVLENPAAGGPQNGDTSGEGGSGSLKTAGTIAVILALYLLMRGVAGSSLAGAFPLAEAGVSYGMLFLIGLITSVHCIAMCGGINLSQTLHVSGTAGLPSAASRRVTLFLPGILYNGGRIASYTAAGVLAGGLGRAVTVTGRFQGAVQLAAGVFMAVMGLNMLGIFPALRRFVPRLPRRLTEKLDLQKARAKSPFLIGLLNGLMPCGPLQAMQIYAISTGSPLAGGTAMFLFALGTTPLMFGIGALSSALTGAKGRIFARRVTQTGAMLVAAMGLAMFSNGWTLAGIGSPLALFAGITPSMQRGGTAEGTAAFTPVIENGVQIVNSTLSPSRYPAITVLEGVPVRWTINAPAGSINGCNNRIIIREYGIEYRFKTGDNVIEFMPSRTGRFSYSCWMGMIRSSITVAAEGEAVAVESLNGDNERPEPAGVTIPVDTIAFAEPRDGGYQEVHIQLRDDRIEPAVIVLRRGLPAQWVINNDSLDPGNSRLLFPAYAAQIDIETGDNVLTLLPSEDFDFSTADNILYGYVKVVDDLAAVDVAALKAEVADYETLIYPDAYFDGQGAGGCCAR